MFVGENEAVLAHNKAGAAGGAFDLVVRMLLILGREPGDDPVAELEVSRQPPLLAAAIEQVLGVSRVSA